MKTTLAAPSTRSTPRAADRGSVLVTALVLAAIIGITLVGYLKLSTNSLKLAHRTFFADAAANLAEAGTEEAVWSFNKLGAATDATSVANAWTGWTLGNTVADVYMSSNGTGYTSAPTVSFSGGGGSGAAGYATITTFYRYNTSGVAIPYTGVSNIVVTSVGSGYTSAPTVTLTGGGGTLAAATVRLSATRTFTFNNLDQGASGTVKVWVGGYDGSAVVPMVLAKATITLAEGAPIEKTLKVILSKNGALPKGVVAKNGVNWNGHPLADSFRSSTTAGVPPFTAYDENTARSNTTLASLKGPTINLGSQGVVEGNVMTGPGVTVTGSGTITGQKIGNFTYNFTMPTYPVNSGATAGYALTTIPAVLPRPDVKTGGTLVTAADPDTGRPEVRTGGTTLVTAGDVPAADGNYYYYVSGATIGSLTITAGKKVVIVGSGGTQIASGLRVPADDVVTPKEVGKLTVYMDGTISLSGNDKVNKIASPNTSWAGALEVYTTWGGDISFSGNAAFYGSIFAPSATMDGNGGGNDQMDLCGSFVVGAINSNGHMSFHYDEGLGTTPNPKPWGLALWKEMQTATERAQYASRFNF